MMLAQLQSHSSVCGFYTIFAAFNPFMLCPEEITGDHEYSILWFIGNYM